MRTTTLALLSGAAMSISAASIYNVTPTGGFRDHETHALLEPLAPRAWPQRELAEATASAFAPVASAAVPMTIAASTAPPFRDEPAPTAVAVATAGPRESPAQFAVAKPPSTKSASGWRGQRNPNPPPKPFISLGAEPQPPPRVVVVRQQSQPQMAPPTATAPMFQSAPPSSSAAAPASTSSARPLSTSR
jgi:hypothetical protein